MKQKSIWKEWIPIIREKYRKIQTFQSNGFLKYFGWSRNPYNFQNMGKVNSHSNEKLWENTNISNLSVSEIFCLKQKSMQFPKHRKSGLPLYGKSMEKQTFQIYGLLKYFGWSRNPYNSQSMGKVNAHDTGRVWEKTNIPK